MSAESYFSREEIEHFRELLKENDEAPQWLEEALSHAIMLKELLPPEEDENRFVVEYSYPH